MYTVQCTVYTVHRTVYTMHCAMYTINCTVYFVDVIHVIQCTQCELYSVYIEINITYPSKLENT